MKDNQAHVQSKNSLNCRLHPLLSQIKLSKTIYKHKSKLLNKKESGSAVIEVVIVIAVLIAVALIFNKTLREYANSLIQVVFGERGFFDSLKPGV